MARRLDLDDLCRNWAACRAAVLPHACDRDGRETATGQVFPEIDVELHGDVHETTITRAKPPRQLNEHTSRYRNTLVVTKADGYWLICGYRSDPRTSGCVTAT